MCLIFTKDTFLPTDCPLVRCIHRYGRFILYFSKEHLSMILYIYNKRVYNTYNKQDYKCICICMYVCIGIQLATVTYA